MSKHTLTKEIEREAVREMHGGMHLWIWCEYAGSWAAVSPIQVFPSEITTMVCEACYEPLEHKHHAWSRRRMEKDKEASA